MTTSDAPYLEVPVRKGLPKITLLSPTPTSLSSLFEVWDRELKKLGKSEAAQPQPPGERGGPVDLVVLASKVTPIDQSPANGSSIAFLLEHQGVSAMLAADAHPTVLVPALKALASHRGASAPLKVDVFKLSHHGSRANLTVELLQAVQAKHYIVSTNSAIFGHPDDEAIARVIVKGGSQRKIWFNYRTEHTAKWGAADLQKRYGYLAALPEGEQAAVNIALAA